MGNWVWVQGHLSKVPRLVGDGRRESCLDQESRIGMNGWWDEWAAALVAKVGADEWRRGCRGAEGIGEGRGEGGGGGEGGEGGGGG